MHLRSQPRSVRHNRWHSCYSPPTCFCPHFISSPLWWCRYAVAFHAGVALGGVVAPCPVTESNQSLSELFILARPRVVVTTSAYLGAWVMLRCAWLLRVGSLWMALALAHLQPSLELL